MFFTPFWWGGSQGMGTQLAYAIFHPGRLKNRSFPTLFFYIVITENDHPRYVKHVLGHIYMFSTLFGYYLLGGGVLPRGWYTTCLCSFSIEVFETCFYDVVITKNDAWIFIATTLLFIAILLHSLWTLQAMAGHVSSYRGGCGLRSPTRGNYALCEANRLGSPLCEPAWVSIV